MPVSSEGIPLCAIAPAKMQWKESVQSTVLQMGTGTVQTSDGNWVNANWNGKQLNVNNLNGNANDNTGSCVLRHFLLSFTKIP